MTPRLDDVTCYRCMDSWGPCEENDFNFFFCYTCQDDILEEDAKEWTFMRFAHGHHSKGMWWFRLFGYGIHAKNTNIHDLKFSERIGATKTLRIGNWSFRVLVR